MRSAFQHAISAARVAAMLLLAASGSLAFAAAGDGVINSRHDFSATGPNPTYRGTSTQVCIYCHAPHASTTGTPLWNHAQTGATFTLYSSPTLKATMGQPGGVSKLCLSCHDGTVAIDSFGGATGTKTATGAALLGTDLSNDHPIGFAYNAALLASDPGLADPSTKTVGIGVGGANTGTITAKMLFNDQMECASCHDVHNSAAGTAVEAKLVRISTAGSALCVACHRK